MGFLKKIFKRKKEETISQVYLTPTTITGGSETGGIITGGSTDIITPSRPISGGGSSGSGGSGGTSGGGGGSSGTSSVGTSVGNITTYKDIKIPDSVTRQIQTQEQLRKRDVYNPKTNTYQRSAYGYGAGGTAIERTPTYQEQLKINQAYDKGDIGYQLTGHSSRDYKEFINLEKKAYETGGDLSKEGKSVEEEINRFENNYKRYIEDDKFAGTKEEYKAYKEDYSKLNKKMAKYNKNLVRYKDIQERYKRKGGSISDTGKMEMPKVNIGGGKAGAIVGATLGGVQSIYDYTLGKKKLETYKGKDVSLSKFKGLYSKNIGVQASAGVSFFAKTGAQISGERFGIALGGEKKYVLAKEKFVPSKTIEGVYKPQYGTATEYNALGMAQPKYEDIKVKAHTRPELYFTGEQLGQATGDILGGVGVASKVLLPYGIGTTLYFSDASERVKESGGVKQYVKENPVEAALLGSVVLGGAAYVGVKYLKSPIIKKIPQGYKVTTRWDEFAGQRIRFVEMGKSTRVSGRRLIEVIPSKRYLKKVTSKVIKKPEVSFLEIGQKTIQGEKIIQKSYPIIVEQPAITKELYLFSKAGKGKFGEEASKIINIRYKQPKITSPFADRPIISDGGFILRTQRIGKTSKLGKPKYTFINQEQKFKQFEDISKLNKVERYTLLKTLEKGKLEGKTIKDKDILKYLTEEEKIQIGISKELDITKPIGKTTSTFQKTAIVKELKPIGEIKVYDIKSGAKDISKTYPRAIGDVSLIKGRYLEFPPIDKTPKDVTTIVSKSGKRTSLSSIFNQQEVQALKYIKKVPKTPTKTFIPSPIVTQKEYPSMVGGTGVITSPYTGTGMYERTEEVGAMQLRGLTQPSFIKEKQLDIQKTTPTTFSGFKQEIESREELKSVLDVKPIQKSVQPQKEAIKESQAIKQVLKLKQQFLVEELILKQQMLKQAQRIRKPLKPTKIIIPFKLSEAITKVEKMKREKPELFKAFGKRFGKEVKLGIFKTKSKAEEKLSKFLKGTLGAAGFITKDKKKLKSSEIELLKEKGFRKSKLSEFLIIEKKEKRLRKSGTGKIIQAFRKNPTKRRKKGKSLFGI